MSSRCFSAKAAFVAVGLSLAALAGCTPRAAAPPSAPTSAAPAAPAERQRVGVIVTTAEAIPVSELLARAERRLAQGDFALARRDFELLLAAAHEKETEARIRLGYARALEGAGELELAVSQLELRLQLVDESQLDAARIELVLRLLLLERFHEAGAVAVEVDRARVGAEDVVLLSAAGALSAPSDPDRADSMLAPAWALLDGDGPSPSRSFRTPAAWLNFAAGEVAAARARRVVFDPVPDDVAAQLEARCRPALAAQSAYAEAMRLESGWLRLLSGERIAQLYLELHQDILAAPLPAGFKGPEKQALAQGALLLRYEVLLEKAEQMLRVTLSGTPDTPAARPVRERVEARLREVVGKRAAHAAEVDDLPVLRSDLSRILESLGAPPTAPQPTSGGTR